MTNIDRLKSDHARLVRDLEREKAKSERLRKDVDRAESKEKAAFAAVKRAKPEHRAQAEAKKKAATAESDRVHAIYMKHARGDVKRAHDKVIAAYLRLRAAQDAGGVTVNIAHPGSVVGMQARNITGGSYRF
jgi:hypothetical protein